MIDLEQRIKTALNNYCGNKDAMHVPPKDTDVDVVLSDCLKEIESLRAQLAQYQSDDCVLVPKELSNDMWEVMWEEFECSESMHKAYKAMIEAQEQHNAKP